MLNIKGLGYPNLGGMCPLGSYPPNNLMLAIPFIQSLHVLYLLVVIYMSSCYF